MNQPFRILSESEASLESFHDCHVHGLHWRRDQFSFSMDLQYILKWIMPPDDSSGDYHFAISEGRLTFRDVDEPKVSMNWSGEALDAQIATMRILNTRKTPNGTLQRHFEVEFASPDATISLWSTGYEIRLLREPVISSTQSISMLDKP